MSWYNRTNKSLTNDCYLIHQKNLFNSHRQMLHTHVKSMHAYDSIVYCHCHISSDTSCVCMYHISSEPIRYNEFISCDIIYCQQVHCLRDILLLTMQMHIHFDAISTFRKVKRSCIYPPRVFITISLGRFNKIANGGYVERARMHAHILLLLSAFWCKLQIRFCWIQMTTRIGH